MVLESLLEPESAAKNPLKITVFAILFVTLGVWAAQFFEPSVAGLIVVFAVAIPSIPMINSLFSYEESETEGAASALARGNTLARHVGIIIVLVAYFVGLVLGFTFWYLALPPETSQMIFSTQVSEINQIQGRITGFAISFNQAFETIFMRNLQVLGIILATSLLYGAGCIFILAWNASVIGVFIGKLAEVYVFQSAPELSVAVGIGKGMLGLVPHGSFELLAYLTAALAGGILSSAIVRKAYLKPEFAVILYDFAKLVSWSIILLAIGAFIEGNALAGL